MEAGSSRRSEGSSGSTRIVPKETPETVVKHATDIFNYFLELQKQQIFLDVHLESSGEQLLSMHRLMLAAFSEVLRDSLSAAENCSSVRMDFDPQNTGVEGPELVDLAEFCYTGEFIRTPRLLNAAQILGFTTLLKAAAENVVPYGHRVVDKRHQLNFLEAMKQFRDETLFSDCVLVASDNTFVAKCHRLLLASQSKHFEATILNTFDSHILTLSIDTCSLDAVKVSKLDIRSFIDFTYTGVVRGNSRRLPFLHIAAQTIGMDWLVSCIDAEMRRSEIAAREAMRLKRQALEMADDDMSEPPVLEQMTIVNEFTENQAVEEEELTQSQELARDYESIYDEFMIGPPSSARHHGMRGDGAGKAHAVVFSQDLPGTSAMTVSYSHAAKHSVTTRPVDSFGYGLPEYVGRSSVEMPMVIGNQQQMMEKLFKCPHCDHRSNEKASITKHVRCIHTGEAPFKCRFCDQHFKVHSNLIRHIRVHTGEKPYACKKCGTTYADKKNLDGHVYKMHLLTGQIMCPQRYCFSKFWRQDRYQAHMKSRHGIDVNACEPSTSQQSERHA